MITTRNHPAAGFSLLELIVTIVVAAILGSLMVQFSGTALIGIADSVSLVRDEAAANNVLERIVSDYVQAVNTAPDTALATIVTNIDSNAYGTDITITRNYTDFTAGGAEVSPAPADSETLKVTVQGGGYRSTVLLSESRVRADDPTSRY
ncbi:hypothetical protein D3OALGA1CA_3688 [Olavius algarvensis associated proteobacterium Delta 3]|nr:hypothetical protein D3OALGA1CA_3688 [Olavius algarvensis associated proteobacterium Delta 3]CAB5148364.1 hypothetical protein D3OALGB2SA_4649 [Olavius algarvensis associated proteobacterium Delta 3]